MTSSPQFVHLNVHTEYSLSEGIARIKDLAIEVHSAGMPAVAMTDINNLYAAVKFYRSCLNAGVKPLFGVELTLGAVTPVDPGGKIILLCLSNRGFKGVSELLTQLYTQPREGRELIASLNQIESVADDVIALTGFEGAIGALIRSGHVSESLQVAEKLIQVFKDRIFFELTRTGRPGETVFEDEALVISRKLNIPLVATNAVRFLKADDFEAHEIRTCIHQGRILDDPRRPRHFTAEQYLRSSEEMSKLFDDLPSAIINTSEIAKKCNVFLDFETTHMPRYPLADNVSADDELIRLSNEGLDRYRELWPARVDDRYAQRLQIETDTINRMGFAGYFLIVADFVRWATENDVPVGPGRGSGAGSLVAFALGITRLDPIDHGLLFERFLNPDRVSLPDFDIDFCMVGRDRVIDYVSQKYGADKVAQIITYNTLAARAVVRDVGRVMGMPYGFCDTLAKLVPFEVGMTLEKALAQDDELRRRFKNEAEVTQLIENGLRLEGIPRNAGKHAGGLVIAPEPISEFSPLYWEHGMSQAVTQFDKDDLESIGLVKFDFLGLRTLTVIDWAVKLINHDRVEAGETELDLERLEPNDPDVYKLICTGRTTALFQLESRGMQELIQRLRPDRFDELVALVALFRPGPLQSGMVDDFIDRKHGRQPVSYLHDTLKTVLEPTYGVILYQEQVMEIARSLAGFSLGSADLLRRAMGKKKPEEMERQRQIFIDGATERGVKAENAVHIFDLIEKFAGYGFNKSHSAAYALLSYQTAWLKKHYPAQFMSAALSADMEHTDKVVILINEAKALGLSIQSPDINQGSLKFAVDSDGSIIYGLGAVKGVGEKALENILDERSLNGAFTDLMSFCRRVDSQKVNKKTFEALICAGALDSFGSARSQLFGQLPQAMEAAGQHIANLSSGQNDMFGLPLTEEIVSLKSGFPTWTARKALEMERHSLGFYLTGHPMAHHRSEISQLVSESIAQTRPTPERVVTLSGLVQGLRTFQNRRGETMAFFQLDDGTGFADVSVFPDTYGQFRSALSSNGIVLTRGLTGVDDRSGLLSLKIEGIWTLKEARERALTSLSVSLPQGVAGAKIIQDLQGMLRKFVPGPTNINIEYLNQEGDSLSMSLGDQWRVQPDEDLIESLLTLAGESGVKFLYRSSLLTAQNLSKIDNLAA